MQTFPPTRILVAIDFGDASAHAVRAAGVLAAAFTAPLVGVHAESLEAPPYFTPDQIEALEGQQLAARKRAARYLVQTAAKLTRVAIEPRIVNGPAAAAIIDAAAAGDLVVMGTHGRRGPSRWWLGSVAERVVRSAPAPVLVVRAGDAGADSAGPADHFRRILVVGEEGAEASSAEGYATRLARQFDGRVVERLTRCREEMAVQREASLVAVDVPGQSGGPLSEAAERLIRTCQLPMLFVPQ